MKTPCNLRLARLTGLAVLVLAACSNEVRQRGELFPERRSANEIAADYREALKTWNETRPRHYTMHFRYGAFTPVAGNWEVEVRDGRVVRRMHDGQPVPADRPAMTNMRMERFFELAAPATNAEHPGPMRIFARFTRQGWVADVRRTKNPDSDLPMPKDLTWFYEIRSLTIHQ